MQPYECYQTYVALKLHFNSEKYDYFKANGKTRTSALSYENRRDKYFFEKLARKYNTEQIEHFLLANFVKDNGLWIGESFTDEAKSNYLQWKKRVQGLTYNFKEDVNHLLGLELFDDLFRVKPNEHPVILKQYLQGEISLESFIIINEIVDFFTVWNKKMKSDIVWKDVRIKAMKYRPFLLNAIDLEKLKSILKSEIAAKLSTKSL